MSTETRSIKLPKGETLEIEMQPGFLAAIRKHFKLNDDQIVEDDHVRMYLWGAVNSAVSEAEAINEDEQRQSPRDPT